MISGKKLGRTKDGMAIPDGTLQSDHATTCKSYCLNTSQPCTASVAGEVGE